MKNLLTGLTILAFVLEVVMVIPVLGATLVIASGYSLLVLAFGAHLALLVLRIVSNKKEEAPTNLPIASPIVGVVGSTVAWIPLIGWSMHLATAILYLIELANGKHKA